VSGAVTFSAGLDDWQRAELARHLEITYHLNYGGAENAGANYRRENPADCVLPDCLTKSPPAVLLRELAEAARAGGTVEVPRLTKADSVRVSELLRQTARRPANEGTTWGDVTARELASLARSWDESYKVPQDEDERAAYVRVPVRAI
jgi:hypothetical protein